MAGSTIGTVTFGGWKPVQCRAAWQFKNVVFMSRSERCIGEWRHSYRDPGEIITIVVFGIARDGGQNHGRQPRQGVSGFSYGGVAGTDYGAV